MTPVKRLVTTGPPPRGMAMLVEPLQLTTPIAAVNGGMGVQPDLATVVEQCALPLAVTHEVMDYLLGEDALSGVEAERAGHFACVVGVDRVGQAAELRRHGAEVAVTDLAALREQHP